MRRTNTILSVLFAAIGILRGANTDRTPEDLKSRAREVLSKLVKVPVDCRTTVEPITGGRGKGRKVVFEMEVPDTVWTMSSYPEVHFLARQDGPVVRVWDATRGEPNMPHPQAIAQWFLIKERDPGRCIKILALWFDVNRNKGRTVNFAYDRYAWAYREAGKEEEWLSTLKTERELATAPEAIYEIHKHMARVCLSRSSPELAIKNWLLAQAAMKSQSNSYIATRYALPYLEIAKIHKQHGDVDKAAQNLERYLATPQGTEDPIEPIQLLGEIYAAKQQFGKARKLYMSVLAEDYGKNWASQTHLRRCQEPIREKVRLLDLQEKLASLIGKLADDGKAGTEAYREIQALGKDVVPLLKRYKDHENLAIRGSVQELIKELQ